jgi:hypothetical protein
MSCGCRDERDGSFRLRAPSSMKATGRSWARVSQCPARPSVRPRLKAFHSINGLMSSGAKTHVDLDAKAADLVRAGVHREADRVARPSQPGPPVARGHRGRPRGRGRIADRTSRLDWR